jgi:hypothetical protein
MNPKIDTVVMKPNGQQATVSGPIDWESDDISATFSAVIAQMNQSTGTIVLATGANAQVYMSPGDLRWQADVQTVGGGRLVLGNAEGWGIGAEVNTGGRECYPWQVEDLTIVDQQPVVVSAPPH